MLSLGDALVDVLPELREMAESLMTDTCTVKWPTSSSVNQTTGVETVTYRTDYTGKCKFQDGGTQAMTAEAGGAVFTVERPEVHFPIGAFTPLIGHVIERTVAPLDPSLVGHPVRVSSLPRGSQRTAMRLGVEEMV